MMFDVTLGRLVEVDVIEAPLDPVIPAPTVEDRLAAIEDTTGAIIGILAGIEGVTL